MSSFFYFIKQSWMGIKCHKLVTFATICVMTVSMLLIGTFFLIYTNLNNTISGLEQGNMLIAYVDENLSDTNAKGLKKQIEAIDGVKNVAFETREHAMEEFVSYMKSPELSELPATVLRHRYNIQAENSTVLPNVVESVKRISGIASVSASLEVAQGFADIGNATTAISSVVIVVLIMFSFFMMTNVIRIAASSREKEIGIMRMCGVSNSFIRAPFYVEGLIIGVVSAIMSFVGEAIIYGEIVNKLNASEASRLIVFTDFSAYSQLLIISFITVGIMISVTGTMCSIRKYMKM